MTAFTIFVLDPAPAIKNVKLAPASILPNESISVHLSVLMGKKLLKRKVVVVGRFKPVEIFFLKIMCN